MIPLQIALLEKSFSGKVARVLYESERGRRQKKGSQQQNTKNWCDFKAIVHNMYGFIATLRLGFRRAEANCAQRHTTEKNASRKKSLYYM